jgi:DNA modification methylase
MTYKRKEVIGDCTLYQGDCLDIIPMLEHDAIDACVTDPPYGLGKKMQGGTWGAQEHNEGFLKWDLEAPHYAVGQLVQQNALRSPKDFIIWGGNYFSMPASRCWLIWSKVNAVPTMADFEMAWTNLDRPSKRIELPVGRVTCGHPTEKPLPLMTWCLGFIPNAQTILDPFMGSGTTGVACVKTGRKFVGIELDPEYFDIACKRIGDAYKQPDMFVAPPSKPVQESLV